MCSRPTLSEVRVSGPVLASNRINSARRAAGTSGHATIQRAPTFFLLFMALNFESLKSLHLTMRFDGTTLSTGTGFFARSRSNRVCLITNRHNVTGRRT